MMLGKLFSFSNLDPNFNPFTLNLRQYPYRIAVRIIGDDVRKTFGTVAGTA